MPIDGQQVYGAQHPPSIKLIKELTSSSASGTSTSLLTGSLSTATASSGASGGSVGNAFKDFEKKTDDVWDLEDDESTGFKNDAYFQFPISIPDSEEVAKKIIKSHRESQEKLSSPKSTASVAANTSNVINSSMSPTGGIKGPASNGPGKALRQEDKSAWRMGALSGTLPNSSSSSSSSTAAAHLRSNNSNNNNNQNNHNDIQQSPQLTTPTPTVASSHSQALGGVVSGPLNAATNMAAALSVEQQTKQQQEQHPHQQSSSSTEPAFGVNKFAFNYSLNRDKEEDPTNCEKFRQILGQNPVHLEELQKASWKGIPRSYRPVCWKLLSDYLPLKQELQEKTIEQKRNAYWESVNEHYSSVYLESHHEMLRQILNDIPRMNPLLPIFQKKVVQNIFQRVLYVWAVRHPASGYVQGINDLLTPFFAVFLTEYSDPNLEIQSIDIESMDERHLRQLEADSYWCMTKLLERIQENYVFSQPGIQRNIQSLEDLIKRIDRNLHQHLKRNSIDFIQFAFRWMNNLLMREIPLVCTIRLWDTYHAEPFGFSDFHLYVCAAFLLRYSKQLTDEKDFQGLMLLLQNLPTRNLKANDVALLTAEAYKLQVMFADSPNHTATNH